MFGIRSARLVLCVCSAAALATATPALAQGTNGSSMSADQTPVESFAAGPKPGTFAGTATVGFKLEEGLTETLGYSADGVLAYMTSHKQLMRFVVEEAHGEYRPSPGASRLTVENNHEATFDVIQGINKHFGAMAGFEFRRDTILALNYRAYGRGGVGFLFDGKKANLLLGVGAAGGREHSLVPNSPTGYYGVGLLESLTVHPTRTFVVEDSLSSVVNTSNNGDRSTTLHVSTTAMIASHAGLKLAYKYQYDRIHPVFSAATQQEFTVGVQFSFAAK